MKSWDKRVSPLVGLQHVTRLDVVSEVKDADQWRQLQHITSQLPKLNTLRFLSVSPALVSFHVAFANSLSSLTSLTRLDIQHPKTPNLSRQGVPLPSLKAASFALQCDLEDIAALAPNLEQLYCSYLNIQDSPAALPACTHFGSCAIRMTSNTAAAAAQAFAAAFPNLQVVTRMPIIRGTRQLSAQQLLAQLPSVLALRGWLTNVLQSTAAAGLKVPAQLQRLCLHAHDALNIPSISSMSQLQHVHITFDEADETTSQLLLHKLAPLPQLQSLVLPAGLLCSRCCPGVQSSLAALTAKSSLKQLVFLEWRNPYYGGFETGFWCTHPEDIATGVHCTHTEAIQAGLQSVAAAAAAAAASTQKHCSLQQQQQQQQLLTVLHQQQHREAMPGPWEANPDSAAGVWGVYGPPGEW